jgi:2-polyprenyl-3-methyl-5-hydroxy-6-metoxy-1,4-benzoquinol methylase
MKCKICNSSVGKFFSTKILSEYEVSYFKCLQCGFIQTEEPYWLNEAYGNAITFSDIGLLNRNIYLSSIVKSIISLFFDVEGNFIDYGAGYGILVRLMRDKGLNFYWQDIYCENIFAKSFEIKDNKSTEGYEVLTAFEVFEHLKDPLTEIEIMLSYSENLLFSTELQPDQKLLDKNWWYFSPETGQHISFYTTQSLELLAQKFQLRLYSNGRNIHLLTKKRINPLLFLLVTHIKISRLYNIMFANKRSLTQSDYNYILSQIQS